jgi:hypothetical protein
MSLMRNGVRPAHIDDRPWAQHTGFKQYRGGNLVVGDYSSLFCNTNIIARTVVGHAALGLVYLE